MEKKRAEEREKESRKTKEKYTMIMLGKICVKTQKLKQLWVPELNKYLKHHGLDQHIKNTVKKDKSLLQMNPDGPDALMA